MSDIRRAHEDLAGRGARAASCCSIPRAEIEARSRSVAGRGGPAAAAGRAAGRGEPGARPPPLMAPPPRVAVGSLRPRLRSPRPSRASRAGDRVALQRLAHALPRGRGTGAEARGGPVLHPRPVRRVRARQVPHRRPHARECCAAPRRPARASSSCPGSAGRSSGSAAGSARPPRPARACEPVPRRPHSRAPRRHPGHPRFRGLVPRPRSAVDRRSTTENMSAARRSEAIRRAA